MIRFRNRAEPSEKAKEVPAMNGYYEAISERLGILQVVLYLSLFAFVILSFLRNTGLITYQNLYYFFKDLHASAEAVDVLHTEAVSYPTDDEQSFTLYRRGLAVAGNNSVTLFTASGRQTLSETIQYQNPVAVGTGKYLLVYELGGVNYSLYNSYTRIHVGQTAHPIRTAKISTSGICAFVSYSADYDSVVELYDRNFERINRYTYHSYVSDVAVNEKGNVLAVLTSTPTDGKFVTSLRLYTPGTTETIAETELDCGLGLCCAFSSSGTVEVLSGNGIFLFSSRGKPIAEERFDGETVLCADVGAEGVCAVLKSSSLSQKIHILVFDKSGKMLYNDSVPEKADAVAYAGGSVFLARGDGVTRLRLKTGGTEFLSCRTEDRALIALDGEQFLLCSPQQAVTYRFFD